MVKAKLKALEVIDSLLNFEDDLRLEVCIVAAVLLTHTALHC